MLRLGVLLILGAVIAYIGDRIGTRIGKKRLSIFGMRPKNTAVLMTVCTGMVITLATLAVFSVFVPNVRLALFEDIEQIKEKNSALEAEYLHFAKQKADLSEQVVLIQKDTARLQEERSKLEASRSGTEQEISRLKEERKNLNLELEKNVKEEEELKQKLSHLNTQIHSLKEQSEKALQTIANLSNVIETKEQRRLVLHHLEPLIEKPLELSAPLNPKEFNSVFQSLLETVAQRMQELKIPAPVLNQNNNSRMELEVRTTVENVWIVSKPKSVLIYPVCPNNLVAGESLRDIRFIVTHNRLLIPKGYEIQRMVLDTDTSIESLLKTVFEKDESIKKMMFAQGVLGNPFRPRTARQIVQFTRFVEALMAEKPKAYVSIVADNDIYSLGNFAFRYNIIAPPKSSASSTDSRPSSGAATNGSP